MGRKNSRANRTRLQRRQRGEKPLKVSGLPAIQIEDLIIPDGVCNFQGRKKARFATEERAATALRQAQHNRARRGSGHVEKRYYPCPEGGCGGFHLTSRETYDADAWKRRQNG